MDIWSIDKLVIFIAFVIPGFITLKVYDLLIPGETKTPGQSILQAIVYSCVNYAVFAWLLFISSIPSWITIITVYVVLLLSPIALAFLFCWLRKNKHFQNHLLHPAPKPWDYIFGKKQAYWIIIELCDGSHIGGTYDTDSFTSSFPAEEQIYLQEEWVLDGTKFVEPKNRSKGILISGTSIKSVRFFS